MINSKITNHFPSSFYERICECNLAPVIDERNFFLKEELCGAKKNLHLKLITKWCAKCDKLEVIPIPIETDFFYVCKISEQEGKKFF